MNNGLLVVGYLTEQVGRWVWQVSGLDCPSGAASLLMKSYYETESPEIVEITCRTIVCYAKGVLSF